MRAKDFLKDNSDLPDMGKDTWVSDHWEQQIGVDGGQGYQRASGNLPGDVNLSIAADSVGPTSQFMPQKGVNISKGPANLYLGDRGAVSGSYNIPLDDKSSVSLNASGQKNLGLTGVGAQYQRGNFSAGVNQGNFPGAKPQFNVGYSAQFEEDSELDEMAGVINVGISQALSKKGYKYLGGGIDKQAFLEPGTGQVLVVFGYNKAAQGGFSKDQMMFVDWAKYCKKNQANPHLPRFSDWASFDYHGKRYLQIRMEPLQELSDYLKMLVVDLEEVAKYSKSNPKTAFKKLANFANFNLIDAGEPDDLDHQAVVKNLGGEQAAYNLLKTVYDVKQFGKQHGFKIDLHSGNYMQRSDGTIVVNDPYVLTFY